MTRNDPSRLLAALHQLERIRQGEGHEAKRSFRRFVVRGDAELQSLDPAHRDEPPVPVHLRDIGRAGIGFLTQRRLPDNTVWNAAFIQRGHIVATQACIVRHCREVMDGVYLVGAQFCCDNGLFVLLGVDTGKIDAGDGPAELADSNFVSPAEVA